MSLTVYVLCVIAVYQAWLLWRITAANERLLKSLEDLVKLQENALQGPEIMSGEQVMTQVVSRLREVQREQRERSTPKYPPSA